MQGVLSYRAGWRGVWGEEGAKKVGFRGVSEISKMNLALERCAIFGEKGTPLFGPTVVSYRKTHGFWRACFWSYFLKGLQKTCECAPPPFGAPAGHF